MKHSGLYLSHSYENIFQSEQEEYICSQTFFCSAP